jgi:hypothetical protein
VVIERDAGPVRDVVKKHRPTWRKPKVETGKDCQAVLLAICMDY